MIKFGLILTCLVVSLNFFGQKNGRDLHKIQTGPYFGVQQGRNLVLEMGAERRMKEIKWIRPKSQAISLGINYDIQENIVGSDLGYWYRPSRTGFTIGGQMALRSDFDNAMLGISPTLGYKIWFLHANAGFYFYPKKIHGIETNSLFVNLRWVISNNSKYKTK